MLMRIDVLDYIQRAQRGRLLMARMVANAMGNPAHTPVDIAELRTLNWENLAVINAFLDWAAVHWKHRFTNDQIDAILHPFKETDLHGDSSVQQLPLDF